MLVMFYRGLETTPFAIFKNVHGIVRCSTGDVVVTLNDNSEITITKDQYTFFGASENKENK